MKSLLVTLALALALPTQLNARPSTVSINGEEIRVDSLVGEYIYLSGRNRVGIILDASQKKGFHVEFLEPFPHNRFIATPIQTVPWWVAFDDAQLLIKLPKTQQLHARLGARNSENPKFIQFLFTDAQKTARLYREDFPDEKDLRAGRMSWMQNPEEEPSDEDPNYLIYESKSAFRPKSLVLTELSKARTVFWRDRSSWAHYFFGQAHRYYSDGRISYAPIKRVSNEAAVASNPNGKNLSDFFESDLTIDAPFDGRKTRLVTKVEEPWRVKVYDPDIQEAYWEGKVTATAGDMSVVQIGNHHQGRILTGSEKGYVLARNSESGHRCMDLVQYFAEDDDE